MHRRSTDTTHRAGPHATHQDGGDEAALLFPLLYFLLNLSLQLGAPDLLLWQGGNRHIKLLVVRRLAGEVFLSGDGDALRR